jgi:hypothetical protein
MRQGALFFTEPTPERVIKLDVPEQWLYAENVDELVLRCLFGNRIRDSFVSP